jgi:hypothetical protein
MAYYITGAGYELDYEDLVYADQHLDPVGYLFPFFGLGHRAPLFAYEQIDLACVFMLEQHDLDDLGFDALEQEYFIELKTALEDA